MRLMPKYRINTLDDLDQISEICEKRDTMRRRFYSKKIVVGSLLEFPLEGRPTT